MANRWGNNGNSGRLYFLGFQNHYRWWLSHEIKEHLLLGRKAMANLDSVLKSKDITLLTKVCLVKAMIFPEIMYEYESWTIKKEESQRIDAFKLGHWRRLLRLPWTARIFKGNQPSIFIGTTDTEVKLQYLILGHLMQRAESLEKTLMLGKTENKRRRWWQGTKLLDDIPDSVDMSLSRLR